MLRDSRGRPERSGQGPAVALWPHQRQAIRAILSGARDGERSTLVSACGTGKTLTAAEVSRRIAPTAPVSYFVPTVELLAQTVREWIAYLGRSAGRVIAVCEGREVRHAGWGAADGLAALGVLVTTDAARLAAELVDDRVTVFATYASLPVIQEAHARHNARAWELVVVDEAHRTAGREGKAWAAVHDDSAVAARRRLYMTATPRIVTGKGPTISMDDEKVFGPVVHRLTFAKAIQLGLLADYRLVAAIVTDAELAALTEREVLTLDGRPVPARMLAAQIALARAVGDYDLRRLITYHSRIAAATRFAATLPNALSLLPSSERGDRPVAAWAVSGRSTGQHRRLVLDSLRAPGERTVVAANAKVFGEGIDVPALDAVMFGDAKQSTVDVVQAVGRTLRKGDDPAKVATVLVPVLTTEEDLAAERFDRAWDGVWQVVRALRAHDERLDTHVESARASRSGSTGAGKARELPWLVATGRQVPAGFAGRVRLQAAQLFATAWQDSYEVAARFYAEHGHLIPPNTDEHYRLWKWLIKQRWSRRHGLLSKEQIEMLDKIGMIWDTAEATWQRQLAELRDWYAEHRSLPPPGTPGERWVRHQRQLYSDGDLLRHRAAALQAVGIDLDPFRTAWERFVAAAEQYRLDHGDLLVPTKWRTPDGYGLGEAVGRVRQQYRKGRLPADRVRTAERLGMVWNPYEERRQRGLAEARAYHAEHGHLRVPVEYIAPSGFKFGTWLSTRRQEYRQGCRDESWVAVLNALDPQWASYTRHGERAPTHEPTPPPPPRPPAAPAVVFLPQQQVDQPGKVGANSKARVMPAASGSGGVLPAINPFSVETE
ncbi:DEAD/DEAH box helicase [Micromonospora sp. CPCC 206061]|uniref:DEAD/DEAH box helicase n=1 Tax=Micromonospora sp. CPCC 206061 TaxID=3122410 RepID=UPI002FF01120